MQVVTFNKLLKDMDTGRGAQTVVKTPLLENKAEAESWLDKIIDVAEAKHQIVLALPMILTNVAFFFIPLVSVMFAGRRNELELAASNLANSWAAVSGLDLMVLSLSHTRTCTLCRMISAELIN